jgi:integrase
VAIDEGLIVKNPAQGLSVRLPQAEQKVLTSEEVQKLLQAADASNHRFYPIWAMALFSGMRSGEMYALKWSDIDFSAGIISVTKQWTNKDGFTATKTRENRVVPISEELKKLLLELRNQRADESEFVLPHLTEWTNGEQARVLRDFCKMIDITQVKFHDLRATFITNMLSQGVPLVTVMSIVGHRQMETTDVYVRLAGVSVKGATNRLGYTLPDSSGARVIKMTPRS